MTCTMPYEFGDIVLVPFPFTNHIASKKRPAVVVSNHAYNLAKPDIVIRQLGRLDEAEQSHLRRVIDETLG